MWFSNVYLKTLREIRIAIGGWGVGMGLFLFVVMSAYPSLVETPEAKASIVSLSNSFAWLAEPVAVDTAGGYVIYKYGFLMLLIALWALLACSRLLRGEEERNSMDVLLSLQHSRGKIALEKMAAVGTALLSMGVLIGLFSFAGAQVTKADFNLFDALLFGLNVTLISAVFGSIALLLSQFTREQGTAAGITGGLLLIFIIVDMVHRIIPDTEWFSRLSPMYYYNLSKPLVPSYGPNPGAMLVLLALTFGFSGVALILFLRRDIGGTVRLPGGLRLLEQSEQSGPSSRQLPVNAWSLRSIYTRSLRMVLFPACWWTLAIAGFASLMVVLVKQTETQLDSLYQSSALIKDFITKVGGEDVNTNASLLSAMFAFVPLMLMAFAVTQANRWAADEEEGRQELVLATPQSRLTVLLGRFAALTTATIIIGVLTLAVTAFAAGVSGLKLDGGNLAAATLSIIPLGLLVAALGYLLSGWLSTAMDTGLLSFLLVIWFLISFVGPELNWPDPTLRLSAFYYYGSPLLHGLPLIDMLGVLVVALVALVLASIRFRSKDIGR